MTDHIPLQLSGSLRRLRARSTFPARAWRCDSCEGIRHPLAVEIMARWTSPRPIGLSEEASTQSRRAGKCVVRRRI